MLGTPQYMSPEQARGDKLDGRSDLFSTGIVLYQMLTGERPFRGDSIVALATKIANDPHHAAPDAEPADVPAALRRVVDRCLAKAPAQRFPDRRASWPKRWPRCWRDSTRPRSEKTKARIVPLRVKWALTMAAVVALVMGVTATVITKRQHAAMMGQATDYGASLARFIARQNAFPALGEEWEAVDEALKKIMKTGNFERIVMIDRKGIVRSSTMPDAGGQALQARGHRGAGQLQGRRAQPRGIRPGATSMLGFEAPVMFQTKPVGRVALGIPEKPLTQVAQSVDHADGRAGGGDHRSPWRSPCTSLPTGSPSRSGWSANRWARSPKAASTTASAK